MDRTVSVTIHWKAVKQYFTMVLFAFNLPMLSVLDLALSGVKGLKMAENWGLLTKGRYHSDKELQPSLTFFGG